MFQAYVFLLLICLTIFLINRKKLPPYFIYLGWLVAVTIVFEPLKMYLSKRNVSYNPLNHLYQFIELWLLCLTYYNYFSIKVLKKIILITLAVLTLAYPLISFFLEGMYNDCNLSFLINSILMIIFSMVFFYDLYITNTEIKVLSFGFFWINCGNLIFTCGTFFQMGLYSYLKNLNPQMANDLYTINHVLNYFLYFTYAAGFLCTKQTS